jgi:hypothetical protein
MVQFIAGLLIGIMLVFTGVVPFEPDFVDVINSKLEELK